MNVLIPECHVLRAVMLPPNDRYPALPLATLYQERTGDLFHVVCSEECFATLRVTDRDEAVTVKATTRQIDLGALGASAKGKAYKLRVVAVLPEPEPASPSLRSEAAAEDKQAAGRREADEDGVPAFKATRRPR